MTIYNRIKQFTNFAARVRLLKRMMKNGEIADYTVDATDKHIAYIDSDHNGWVFVA